MTGSGSTQFDELAAAWKLTNPSAFTYERMQHGAWDGIAIGGSTAASILELGDFHLSPYRIYAPRRINSRNKAISSAIREIQREEVSFVHGLPVTRQERTIFDLVVDHEDMSLVANAFRDAVKGDRFDFTKLSALLISRYGQVKTKFILTELGVQTDAAMKERANEI